MGQKKQPVSQGVCGKKKANHTGLQRGRRSWTELPAGVASSLLSTRTLSLSVHQSPAKPRAWCACSALMWGHVWPVLSSSKSVSFHSWIMKFCPAIWAQKLWEELLEARKLNADQDLMRHPPRDEDLQKTPSLSTMSDIIFFSRSKPWSRRNSQCLNSYYNNNMTFLQYQFFFSRIFYLFMCPYLLVI